MGLTSWMEIRLITTQRESINYEYTELKGTLWMLIEYLEPIFQDLTMELAAVFPMNNFL